MPFWCSVTLEMLNEYLTLSQPVTLTTVYDYILLLEGEVEIAGMLSNIVITQLHCPFK